MPCRPAGASSRTSIFWFLDALNLGEAFPAYHAARAVVSGADGARHAQVSVSAWAKGPRIPPGTVAISPVGGMLPSGAEHVMSVLDQHACSPPTSRGRPFPAYHVARAVVSGADGARRAQVPVSAWAESPCIPPGTVAISPVSGMLPSGAEACHVCPGSACMPTPPVACCIGGRPRV